MVDIKWQSISLYNSHLGTKQSMPILYCEGTVRDAHRIRFECSIGHTLWNKDLYNKSNDYIANRTTSLTVKVIGVIPW